MTLKSLRRASVAAAVGLLAASCGPTAPPAVPAPPPQAVVPVTQRVEPKPLEPPRDPAQALIESAERHFAAGQDALQQGHITSARGEFDAAVAVLLDSPAGARGTPALQAEYELLLDRISALEATALRQGDGFTEARTEPAAIDSLLATATFALPPPALTTSEKVSADLAVTPHDVPIVINDKVLSYVELFQGGLRSFVTEGLSRGSRYLPMIERVFREQGVPRDLAIVPLIESAYMSNALSRASAKGMWQFESDTAQEQGLRVNWFIDERSDPEKATVAAAAYLKQLYEMFDHDWYLALAAYNVGMGKVEKAVKQSGTGDFWKLTASTKYLPKDTREYVPMILAAIIIARNPAQYDFDLDIAEPLAYDTVMVPDALDLRRAAEWTGVSLEEIRDLNPELRRLTTPVGTHLLKVPLGKGEDLRARLASAEPSDFATFDRHTVKKGETLLAIARQFKVTRADLASANSVKITAKLQAGQVLLIPRAPASLTATKPAAPASTSASASGPKSGASSSAGSTVTYRVKPGDTLYAIARQFDTTVEQIKQWNQLRTDTLSVGEKLTIHKH